MNSYVSNKKLKMRLMKETYAVCRLSPMEAIPEWAAHNGFLSITRTEEELSVVCCEDAVPDGIQCDKDWKIFKVEGPLDFSLIGILASISTILAQKGISIFAISTFDTDYILVKNMNVNTAIHALIEHGYEVES